MKLNINNKEYQVVLKIDMKDIPHVGQHLVSLWVLENKKTYHLFIWDNLDWSIFDRQNKLICEGKRFKEFLEETKQSNLWEGRVDGEKKDG